MKNSDILKILPLLSKEQLRETRAIVDRLMQQTAAENSHAETCLNIINEALCLRVPYSALKQPWKVNADNLAHFIDSNFPRIRKVVRVALFKMCIGLVIDNLRQRDLPVTFATVWDSLVLAPRLLNEQFPGYLEAGLHKIIIKAMSK